MSQLEEIKARAEGLGGISTRDLASKLIEHEQEYKLLAEVEADHRRLIAALEAVEELCEQDYMMSPEQIRQIITEALQ